jgi:hypothetical protein
MGFEGQIFRGTAGTTASTQMTSATDVSIDITRETAKTTKRGNGTSVPMTTERVVAITHQITFSLLNVHGESHLAALIAAASAGTPISLRLKDYAAGKGFDGDVTLDCKDSMNLAGEQTKEFTASPTDEKGRLPQSYV